MSIDIRRIKDFGINEWKKLFGKGTYADPYIDAVALTDQNGNDADISADGRLNVSVNQDVNVDPNNSSTDNLTSANSYTFTGTGTSTLGVVGLQWNLKTDQNATVYIEQSDDNINWDVSDGFRFLAGNGSAGNTVQAITSYWRIRVVLDVSIDTTFFRLQGVLCPIADPLPRALSDDERLMSESTLTGKENTDRHVWVTPTNALSVESPVRLVGTNFDGTTKDTNFWTETVTNGGTVTQDGEIQLDTNTTANGTAKYESVRSARFVVGSALKLQGLIKFVTAGTTDNVRRAGAYDATDGFFFQLDGTTFSVGWRRSGSDTLVSSGSFNGNIGTTFTPLTTEYYKLEIEWSPKGVFFYVNGRLLHKNGSGHLTGKLTLPITFENVNDNGSTSNVVMDCLGIAIMRLGDLRTNSTYKYISGAATTICKVGAGVLHVLINNDNSGSCVVYDNTAGSGSIIASIDLAKVLGSITFDAPFSTGLTVVTVGAGAKITLVYE